MSQRKLRDWIEAFLQFTENTEAAHLFREWTAVSVVAAALRRKCRLDWGTLIIYPNMYVVLIGPPACRKGTAMDPGLEILLEIPDIKLAAEAVTREALIRSLKKANYTETDMTTGSMNFHSSLTVWSQELTVFLGYHNKQLMSDLCDWYDCRPHWTYETKTQGTDNIIGVWVHIHAATTPELLRSAVPLDAIGSGLTSRMMFVYEPKKGKHVIYPELTEELIALKGQLILDLAHINQMRGVFKYTEGFFNAWADWYAPMENYEPFKDERFNGYFGRRPSHVLKLSTILCASRRDCIRQNTMIVTADDLKKAIDLVERTEKKMPLVFSGIGRAKSADLIPRLIAEIAECKEVFYHQLVYVFHRDAEEREIETAVRTLEQMNAVDIHSFPDGTKKIIYKGRPECFMNSENI
jgi:hypothetical protein